MGDVVTARRQPKPHSRHLKEVGRSLNAAVGLTLFVLVADAAGFPVGAGALVLAQVCVGGLLARGAAIGSTSAARHLKEGAKSSGARYDEGDTEPMRRSGR